jgi:hypothetical protein
VGGHSWCALTVLEPCDMAPDRALGVEGCLIAEDRPLPVTHRILAIACRHRQDTVCDWERTIFCDEASLNTKSSVRRHVTSPSHTPYPGDVCMHIHVAGVELIGSGRVLSELGVVCSYPFSSNFPSQSHCPHFVVSCDPCATNDA